MGNFLKEETLRRIECGGGGGAQDQSRYPTLAIIIIHYSLILSCLILFVCHFVSSFQLFFFSWSYLWIEYFIEFLITF